MLPRRVFRCPPRVDLSDWPRLEDRGDGEAGSPVDHPLISFTAEILASLEPHGGAAIVIPGGDGAAMEEGSDDGGGELRVVVPEQEERAASQSSGASSPDRKPLTQESPI